MARQAWATLIARTYSALVLAPSEGRGPFARMLAPAGTPESIAEKQEAELMRIAQLPAVSQRIKESATVMGSASKDFANFITRQTPVWAAIIKKKDIKLDN